VRVLVTGHHGYLGSILAPGLRGAGHEVHGVDTFFYRGCDFGDGASDPALKPRDVRDVESRELEGFDAVVHLAALSNDPLGDIDSALTYVINRDASISLARAARAAGVSRFVFASSCAIYGAADGDMLLDENARLRPLTPYAQSKVEAEVALRDLTDDRFAAVAMRNATVYGVSPRLRLDVVLNNLVAWAHTTGAVRLRSDGRSWRPLVHVRDVARATVALLEAPHDEVAGKAFNIGSAEQNYRIRELAEIVHKRLPRCDVTYAETASSDPRSYRVDFSRFTTAFPAARPEWSAERGVEELASAYERVGLSVQDFDGQRYARLGQLQRLLDAGELDDELRWRSLRSG
jgi:nucleoside-diphosphate-sugar epimerase